MPNSGSKRNYIRNWPQALVLLIVALLVACGSSATATPSPSDSGPTPTTAATASSSTPTAAVEGTDAPPAMVVPSGTINMGQKETSIFEAHPSKSSSPRIQFTSSSVGEGLITTNRDLSAGPRLAASWSVSDDFLTWTWKFQEGVMFHKG